MPESLIKRKIEDEMKEAYIDYAMSVIIGRALPDAADGLKPVQRRILFTMLELGLLHNKPYKKSARIVGDCMGKFHPHGDSAIYETIVRMAQNFSLRYPLVDGQGNWGSIDGDGAAAMRYTEARLTKIAEELLVSIEKDTVNFAPNFDSTLKEPVILPARIPNLLLNGSTGIAVGMATNIPPHNLSEIADAVIALIHNPGITIEEILGFIKGPDFPTGGLIVGRQGIINAYKTGKGLLTVRARTSIEKNRIVITEIPYLVNKSLLLETIAELIEERKIEGITNLKDESDRNGIRIVLETKLAPEPILNNLFKYTQLQTTFGAILLALYKNQPKLMNLKELLEVFLEHRKEAVTRSSRFDLKKAQERLHIVEGLIIALQDIDNVIKIIKGSKDNNSAKLSLTGAYRLSTAQAEAILDTKLQRLTSFEQTKLREEQKELGFAIDKLNKILGSEQELVSIIKHELLYLKSEYGDKRRTEIQEACEELETEALIPEEDIAITITKAGYIKRTQINEYRQQKRGGKGIIATETKEEDIVESLFTSSTHSYLLFFTNTGRIYWLKAYEIPASSRYSKGKAIVNLLNLKENETISTVVPIRMFDNLHFLIMATKKGIVKKTKLNAYANIRKDGITAINLNKEDELITVRLTPGILRFVIATKKGYAIKFDEKNVRPMGRASMGVRGIKLSKDDEVIGMEVALETASLLTVTENGYGKRSRISDYRLIHRGGKGVINIKTSGRNGDVIGIKTVKEEDEALLITKKGIIIRILVNDIRETGRNTQGVKLIKLDTGDKVTALTRVVAVSPGFNNNNHNNNQDKGTAKQFE
ncbi:DNA gyrase subunit A [archaeon]|nr:DNA gyrase subunit A [archaeon]